MDANEHIKLLKKQLKTYQNTADYIGVSRARYYQWVADPESIPDQGKKLLEFAVIALREGKR